MTLLQRTFEIHSRGLLWISVATCEGIPCVCTPPLPSPAVCQPCPVLARGHQPALADALPDPPGRDSLRAGVVLDVPDDVGGRGRVELCHQVPVKGDEVAAEPGKVLDRGRQVQPHPRENVQQGLLRGKERQSLGKRSLDGSEQTPCPGP